MALAFSLWIESEKEEDKKAIINHFDGRIIETRGKQYPISAYMSGMVTVDGISSTGINNQQDADEMTAIGFELYRLLKKAPEFRYATCGLEVDGWATMKELEESPEDMLIMPGLVIRQDIYEALGSPGNLEEFKPGYLWLHYKGEKFERLGL